jgi:hypothetical protein
MSATDDLDRAFEALGEDIATTESLLDAVTEMQTRLAMIDDLFDDLAVGDEEGQLPEIDRQDVAHEMGVIARALRHLTRIVGAHSEELQELQTVIFTRAENAEMDQQRDGEA